MSEVLDRAKAEQHRHAHNTTIVIRLDLLEDLIKEIERLQHRVDALSQEHPAHKLRPVKDTSA